MIFNIFVVLTIYNNPKQFGLNISVENEENIRTPVHITDFGYCY